MEIHLIRHGETNWNKERRAQGQSESHLTDLGIQQAKELGQRIGQLEFDRIYCSSSLRTRQTAEHAFSESTTEINYLDSLREIFLGPWEGVLYDDIAIREPDSYKHFWEEPHLFNVEGAESFSNLQKRAVETVGEIAAGHPQQKIALVSHGALIKSFLCHLEKRPLSELWAPPKMHNCAHSIVNLDAEGSGIILQYADQSVGEK
jgi:broad specificity phosphatase PhoE|tara:strand:+ start:5226 stop:5837 length:612 start_codon:yes stop_codon:yes gene_type:complete